MLDARQSLEAVLPQLLGSTDRVGVQQDGRFLGFLSRQRVINLLSPAPRELRSTQGLL